MIHLLSIRVMLSYRLCRYCGSLAKLSPAFSGDCYLFSKLERSVSDAGNDAAASDSASSWKTNIRIAVTDFL